MSDLTTYYEKAILDHAFHGNDLTAHTDVYIALHDADPTESGDANELDASTLSYERQSVSTSGGFTRSGSTSENANEIGFGTAAENWGTVTHFSIWDGPGSTADGDNPLYAAALDTQKTVEQNDEVRFNAGDLQITMD